MPEWSSKEALCLTLLILRAGQRSQILLNRQCPKSSPSVTQLTRFCLVLTFRIFEEYDNTGDGSDTSQRVMETTLTSMIQLSTVIPDYGDWIDESY